MFNKSSASDYVGLAWTYRLSDATASGPISWLQQGQGYYDRLNDDSNRWGDYNGICLDPADYNKIWFVGEYAKSENVWGTKVGAVKFDGIPEQVAFTNLIGNENAGGSFTVDGIQNPIPSGQSTTLIQNKPYTVSTNNERFSNWMNSGITYKHHDWNTNNYEYLMRHGFTAGEVEAEQQDAFFLNLNHCTINVLLDGQLISGKGSGEFNDPWFVLDNNNTQPGDHWKQFNSYYEPNGKEGASEKGIFLAQLPELGKYYSARALLMQSPDFGGSLGIRNCYFQNWSSSGADILQTVNNPAGYDQKAIVFNTQDASVTANYKAINISNTQTAFSNSSQRKIVRTPNGSLHLVYESMGKVWYEMSTDNGVSWRLMNGGRPLVSEDAKLPSIEAYDTDSPVFITYQKYLENGFPPNAYSVDLMVYNVNADCPQDVLQAYQSYPYSYNANPVVSFDLDQSLSRVAVVFQDNSETAPGISYRLAGYDPAGIHYEWKSIAARVNGTNGNSVNPSVKSWYYSAGEARSKTEMKFHIAFEQKTAAGSSVEYSLLNINLSGVATTSSIPENVSSEIFPTSTDMNEKPLVTVVNGEPYISWLHYSDFTYLHRAALAEKSSGMWDIFDEYGKEDDITSVHMARVGQSDFVLAWNVDGYGNEFVRSNSPTSTYLTNTSGRDIQAANGSDFTNTRLVSFMNSSLPYFFKTSNALSTGTLAKGTLEKDTRDGSSKPGRTIESRTGIIKINDVSFRATLGEITSGEKSVGFRQINRGFTPEKNSFLRALETEEFDATDKTVLTYLSQFTFNDSAMAAQVFQESLESLSFSTELVDTRSGEVLKQINSGTFSGNSLSRGRPESFRLDLNGIGSRSLRLRISYSLKAKDSIRVEYKLLKSYRPESMMRKENLKNITYSDVKPVTEYALSQNYPNPFNPTTVINYEIPKASKVMLKVYDMLGREVTTLVNELKEMGRYSVKFDASELPSGTYIYEIRANDFVKSGKMLLLK
ncbi:MAG TPA: T9SS type A sorting domain-containing protein [Ignavibacteriales bacterium]|nr:T9SS type A sorting domain-containing protein [Ignavibacteriales bacterium]